MLDIELGPEFWDDAAVFPLGVSEKDEPWTTGKIDGEGASILGFEFCFIWEMKACYWINLDWAFSCEPLALLSFTAWFALV